MPRCRAAALTYLTAASLFMPLYARADAPNSVVGRWQTIDDKTDLPASIVRVELENGKAVGFIEKLLGKGRRADDVCEKCDGANKGKPVVGMKILWDLALDGDSWEGGSILDPEDGKIYRCKIKRRTGTELEVRGYLGISLFGRSQTWTKAADAPPVLAAPVPGTPAPQSGAAVAPNPPAAPATKHP